MRGFADEHICIDKRACICSACGTPPQHATAVCTAALTAPPRPSLPAHHLPPFTRPQILLNLRRGNSGELSLGTCALSFVGNLARVYTTATLVKDPLILGSAAVQARRVMLRGLLQGWPCEACLPVGCGSPSQHSWPARAVLAVSHTFW